MRTPLIAAAVVATVIGLAAPGFGSPTTYPSPSPSPAPTTSPPTHRFLIRPVTDAGRPASGYSVKSDLTAGTVDCSSPQPSLGAVSKNIERCNPSAAYAVACWKSATASEVLCTRDPSSHQLDSMGLVGRFAKTRPVGKRMRSPLLLILADGTRCSIRQGGAWSQLKAHPHWYGSYSCDHHGNVYSPMHAPHYGVNESQPTWTVHTAAASGSGPVTVRSVARAYFVGTKH